jgi:hypothetical protein
VAPISPTAHTADRYRLVVKKKAEAEFWEFVLLKKKARFWGNKIGCGNCNWIIYSWTSYRFEERQKKN